MIYLAAADKQRNLQEATAPKNSETANMVNLGIERLQQLVQQPKSEYASTNRDEESAVAATDSESLAETRYRKRRTGRDANSGTAAARHQGHLVVPHQDTAADSGQ